MLTALKIITSYIMGIISCIQAPTEITNNIAQILKIESCNTQSICSDQEFQHYLMQGQYEHCIDLIKQEYRKPTKKDYDLAALMNNLESQSTHQQHSKACVAFIRHWLQDHDQKIVIPLLPSRGIDDGLLEIQRDKQGPQEAFWKAIKENDTKKMTDLLQKGAQPNLSTNGLTPALFAIAQGHKNALSVLYEVAGVKPSLEHLEQARIREYLTMKNSVSSDPDVIFAGAKDQSGAHMQEMKIRIEVTQYIKKQFPPQPPLMLIPPVIKEETTNDTPAASIKK